MIVKSDLLSLVLTGQPLPLTVEEEPSDDHSDAILAAFTPLRAVRVA